MSDEFSIAKLLDGNAVFLNYWIMIGGLGDEVKTHYDMTILPGRNEELSSASINGFNIGVNRLLEITESKDEDVSNAEKLEAAIKVAEFISSKNLQKKLFTNGKIVTSITSLFEDEEVCSKSDCELFKKMQPIVNRIYEIHGGMFERNEYEFKYNDIAANYLFNDNVDLEDTLKKIDDITRIYYVPFDKIEFSLGFVTVVLIIIIAIFMLISLMFLFFENYQPFFEFFSVDSWFILIFGIIINLFSSLMSVGELTITKCHLKLGLLQMGMTVYLSIIIYELINNLPIEIKVIGWIKKHKYLVLLFIYSYDILLIGLTILNPYENKIVIVEDGHNYRVCEMGNLFGKLLIILLSSEKFIFVLLISFLIFIEWNMKKIFYEIRFTMFAIYSDILLLSLIIIIRLINSKNYYLNFILQQCILLFINLLSYTCLYGFKLFLALLGKKDLKKIFINRINEDFINSSDLKPSKAVEESCTNYRTERTVEGSAVSDTISFNNNDNNDYNDNNNNQQKQTFYSKIISYHYSSFSSVDRDNDESNTPTYN